MAWDDPIVWVLIISVVVFLFGANKIPQFARSIGQARREFDKASKGDFTSDSPSTSVMSTTNATMTVVEDPLVTAAKKEGIDTGGKTREQISSELAWKLSKN
jgi:sec-independent protein translocase protein TatA